MIAKKMKEQKRRDVELLLLGMAMNPETRKKMLAMIPVGFLSREFEPLMNVLREKSPPDVLVQWLADHDAAVEKGESVVDSLFRAVHGDNVQMELSRIAITVVGQCKFGDPASVAESLREMLAVAERLSK